MKHTGHFWMHPSPPSKTGDFPWREEKPRLDGFEPRGIADCPRVSVNFALLARDLVSEPDLVPVI